MATDSITQKRSPFSNPPGFCVFGQSENIKIIPEAQIKTDEFDMAFDKLNSADVIYFLGFGYHEMNMKRLTLFGI